MGDRFSRFRRQDGTGDGSDDQATTGATANTRAPAPAGRQARGKRRASATKCDELCETEFGSVFFFLFIGRGIELSHHSLAKQRSDVVVMAAKAQVSSEAKKNEDEEPKAGELLFCGGSNWEAIGKKQTDGGARGIFLPTRLAALQGIDIAFVASGSGRFPFSVFLSL